MTRRLLLVVLASLPVTVVRAADAPPAADREVRRIRGWHVHLDRGLLASDAEGTARALELMERQLAEIERVVPAAAVAHLRAVPLYVNAEYPGAGPGAEYHPEADWLREHGRDPAMVRGVEFTNVRVFADDTRRMPNFVLHELAHAYHHRVLDGGFANETIAAAFDRARKSGLYDSVERRFGDGRPPQVERAYAMTAVPEYFAEATEAFFSRNDFFPYTRDDLRRHDPEMFAIVARLWGVADPR
jgi:hypothetical protein